MEKISTYFEKGSNEHRISRLEVDSLDLRANLNTLSNIVSKVSEQVADLTVEMKEFKDDMKDFKGEMKEFKDEMKDFKDEMRLSKKEMDKRWGELANKWGTIVEDIVYSNIAGVAKRYFDCNEILFRARNMVKRLKGDKRSIRESDVIVECDEFVLLSETKSSPDREKIEQFARFKDENIFLNYFPEYRDKKIYYIFSSLYIDKHLVELCSKYGIYAMVMGDDGMDILNIDEVGR